MKTKLILLTFMVIISSCDIDQYFRDELVIEVVNKNDITYENVTIYAGRTSFELEKYPNHKIIDGNFVIADSISFSLESLSSKKNTWKPETFGAESSLLIKVTDNQMKYFGYVVGGDYFMESGFIITINNEKIEIKAILD